MLLQENLHKYLAEIWDIFGKASKDEKNVFSAKGFNFCRFKKQIIYIATSTADDLDDLSPCSHELLASN